MGVGLGVGLGIAGAGSLLQGWLGSRSADKQTKAAAKEAQKNREFISRQTGLGLSRFGGEREIAQSELEKIRGMFPRLRQESARSLADIQGGFDAGFNAMRAGVQSGEESLLGGAQAGTGSLQAGQAGALSALGQFVPQELQQQLATDPFANFQADPGFQFRQQQGEQAINRANAARGGRLGGAALKELSQFNQGLASQEFQNFANRQLAERQQNLAGAGQLAGLGLQQAQGLAGIQQTGGQDLAGLQTQSGQNLAQLQAQGGQTLGSLLAQRGQALGGARFGQGQAIFGAESGLQSQLANLALTSGQSQLAAYTGSAQPVPIQSIPGAGGGSAAWANAAGNFANNAAFLAALGSNQGPEKFSF